MLVCWLAGQAPGVMPGGVGVVYAPPGGETDVEGSGWAYPLSAERLVLRRSGSGASAGRGGGVVMRAGLGLVGELVYGPGGDGGPGGLEDFVPRLWSAVNVPGEAACAGLEDGALVGALVNRGAASVGLSDRMAFVDRFDAGGVLGRVRVVGMIERGDAWLQAGADVAVDAFPVMGPQLVDYLRFAVSAQVAGSGYDDLAGVLAKSDRPSHAVVVAGLAPGVTPGVTPGRQCGELIPGDVCHVVAYDSAVLDLEALAAALRGGDTATLEGDGVSWLSQRVESG